MKMVIANNFGSISSVTAKTYIQLLEFCIQSTQKALTTSNVTHLIWNQPFDFYIFELVSFSDIQFKLLIFDCLKYMKYFD